VNRNQPGAQRISIAAENGRKAGHQPGFSVINVINSGE